MRRHGWQLPYHPLQVIAISVFFALVFAFYVFFAPFVGSKLLEVFVIVLYSSTVLVVFALYVWCVAADPADSGLRHFKECNSRTPTTESRGVSSTVLYGAEGKDLEMSTIKQSDQQCVSTLFALRCNQFCKSNAEMVSNEAEMLYCSLCKAEISMASKHCRVCDKCVNGFDHHCRWLNNCVGQKNYKDFVALMVSGIAMLILQWAVGLWILIHCFLKITFFKGVIVSKLGNSFSFIAYVSVVAVCTLVAMAATYPLTQLFFFHILLIRKGISTYDYIIAMREQDPKVSEETLESLSTSPSSSIGTNPSVGNLSGALQGKAWCTPPRLLLDQVQGIYLPEGSFRLKDGSPGRNSKIEYDRKRPVKLDPWALAALSKDDIVHAVMTAKRESSIFRPVLAKHEKLVHECSGRSSPGGPTREYSHLTPASNPCLMLAVTDRILAGQAPSTSFTDQGTFSTKSFDSVRTESEAIIQLARRTHTMLNPLQVEALNAFKSSHAHSGTTFSSPNSCESSDGSLSPHQADLFAGESQLSHVPSYWRCQTQGRESAESDGDVSFPCTPIGQEVYAGQKTGSSF